MKRVCRFSWPEPGHKLYTHSCVDHCTSHNEDIVLNPGERERKRKREKRERGERRIDKENKKEKEEGREILSYSYIDLKYNNVCTCTVCTTVTTQRDQEREEE